MWQRILGIYSRIKLYIKHIHFQLFFKQVPGPGEFCNSKNIVIIKNQSQTTGHDNLVFIRTGAKHSLIDDGSDKSFDIALNYYHHPADESQLKASDYVISGGLNKYKAAHQFISADMLNRYGSFMFLDDDLEITYSALSTFLDYCKTNDFILAQPSLTADSYYSHVEVVNTAKSGWRYEYMVEVMCPYFSSAALKKALPSFDLSYSTWGLDHIWPELLNTKPVVVDEVTIKHVSPHRIDGPFYQYMESIGISPQRELRKIRKLPIMHIKT